MNVLGTKHLLDYCAEYGVKQLTVLSSSYVYGAFADNPSYVDVMHVRIDAIGATPWYVRSEPILSLAGGHRLEFVREVAPAYFTTQEQQEGANAFLEKRKPDFSAFR